MWWILVALTVLGTACCLPAVRFYLGLVWQAVREGRDRNPPLAGA